MSNLPSDAVERQAAILEAIREKWDALPDSGHCYPRRRYIEGLNVFETEFCIDSETGEKRVRYVIVELADLFTTKGSGRTRITHYLYHIEIVYQFEESRPEEGFGTDSATGFNALLARGEEAFGRDETLGFNEAGNANIKTDGLASLGEAEIDFISKVLSHAKRYSLEVTAEAC